MQQGRTRHTGHTEPSVPSFCQTQPPAEGEPFALLQKQANGSPECKEKCFDTTTTLVQDQTDASEVRAFQFSRATAVSYCSQLFLSNAHTTNQITWNTQVSQVATEKTPLGSLIRVITSSEFPTRNSVGTCNSITNVMPPPPHVNAWFLHHLFSDWRPAVYSQSSSCQAHPWLFPPVSDSRQMKKTR